MNEVAVVNSAWSWRQSVSCEKLFSNSLFFACVKLSVWFMDNNVTQLDYASHPESTVSNNCLPNLMQKIKKVVKGLSLNLGIKQSWSNNLNVNKVKLKKINLSFQLFIKFVFRNQI